MTKMRCTGDFNDPWLECDDCGVSFQLVYYDGRWFAWRVGPLFYNRGPY